MSAHDKAYNSQTQWQMGSQKCQVAFFYIDMNYDKQIEQIRECMTFSPVIVESILDMIGNDRCLNSLKELEFIQDKGLWFMGQLCLQNSLIDPVQCCANPNPDLDSNPDSELFGLDSDSDSELKGVDLDSSLLDSDPDLDSRCPDLHITDPVDPL